MTGLQPPDFVVDIKRYGTETVKDTNTAIRTELPLFMAMINKAGYKPAATATEKNVTKTPTKWTGAKTGLYKCQHCDEAGHGYVDCPFKSECLSCKIKAHPYR